MSSIGTHLNSTSIGLAAGMVCDAIDALLDPTTRRESSPLIWIESRPEIGSGLLLESVLHQLTQRRSGWSIAADDAEGWERVDRCRAPLPQPVPRQNAPTTWLCLTLDGSQTRYDGIPQLTQALGVLATVNRHQATEVSRNEALRRLAKQSGQFAASQAVSMAIGLLPGGGVLNTLLGARDAVDTEALRALVRSRRSSGRSAAAELGQSDAAILGEMVADHLLEAVAQFDTKESSLPLVLVVDEAQYLGDEVQALVTRLVLDETWASRRVAVVVASSASEPIAWLDDLVDQLSSADEVPALPAEVPVVPDGNSADVEDGAVDDRTITVTHFTLGHAREHAVALPAVDRSEATALVTWLTPDGALSTEVARTVVARCATSGDGVALALLIDHLATAAHRSGILGLPLDVDWATRLRSRADEVAAELIARLLGAYPGAARLLAATCRLDDRIPRALFDQLVATTAAQADDIAVLKDGGTVSFGTDWVTTPRRRAIGAAFDEEYSQRPPRERQQLEAAVNTAAANWLTHVVHDVETGERDTTWVLERLGEAITAGLKGRATNGLTISRRMRLVLRRWVATDIGPSLEWVDEACADLASIRLDREESWLVLAYVVTTAPWATATTEANRARSTVLGEALGYLADITGCPSDLRRHWAARRLVRHALEHEPAHAELAERAAVAVSADSPSAGRGIVGMLPDLRLGELLDQLVATPPSGDRDALIARCAERGADRIRALAAVTAQHATDWKTALAIAELSDELDDARLDELTAPGGTDVDEEMNLDGAVDEEVPAIAAPPGPRASEVRRGATTLLAALGADPDADPETTGAARNALARIAVSSGDSSGIAAAYREISAHCRSGSDAVLLCRLAEHADSAMRSEALELAAAFQSGATGAAAMARLVQAGDEAPPALLKQLDLHQGDPRCCAHLMRLSPRWLHNRTQLAVLAKAADDDDQTIIRELDAFADRDARALLVLTACLREANEPPAPGWVASLVAQIDAVTEQEQGQFAAALVGLVRWIDDEDIADVARVAGLAFVADTRWHQNDIDAISRAVVAAGQQFDPWPGLRTEALGMLWSRVGEPRNAIALAHHLSTRNHVHAKQSQQARQAQQTRLAKQTRRVQQALLEAAEDDSDAARAALRLPGLSAAAREFCWHALRRDATTSPSLALQLHSLASTPDETAVAERLIRVHAPADIGCALHLARTSASIDDTIADTLVRWAQFDARAASRVAAAFPFDGTTVDRLGPDRRRALRAALLRHAGTSTRCARALLDHDQPARQTLAQLFGVARRARGGLDQAVLMVRTASSPLQATEALDALRREVRRSGRLGQSAVAKLATTRSDAVVAWAQLVDIRYRNLGRRTVSTVIDRCLQAARESADHPARPVRMASWAVAHDLFVDRHRYSAQSGKNPRELGDAAFAIMQIHAGAPLIAPIFFSALVEAAGRSHPVEVRRLLVQHLQTAADPSSFAAKALLADAQHLQKRLAAEQPGSGSWKRYRATIDRIYATFTAQQHKSPAIQAAALVLDASLRRRPVDLSSLVEHSQGRQFSLPTVVEYVRLRAVDRRARHGSARPIPLQRIAEQVLEGWHRKLPENVIHRCVARTAGETDPILLLIRALVLQQLGDPARLDTFRAQLLEHLHEPLVAIAFGRLANSSYDVELARSSLIRHVAADPTAARETLRLGLTMRRRRELFALVRTASYRSPVDRAVLLGELAGDDDERAVARAALLDLGRHSGRSLELLVEVSNGDLELVDMITDARKTTSGVHDRHLLARAMVPLYQRAGGFEGTGFDLLEWLGDEIEWPATALELLRADQPSSDGPTMLSAEQRAQALRHATRGVRNTQLRLEQLLPLLTRDEEQQVLLGVLDRIKDPEVLAETVYRLDRSLEPERTVQALRPHWPTSTSTIIAALWKLDGRDLDDELFAAAWQALATQAMTTPALLVRLAQFSKRPQTQLALVRLLLCLRTWAARSETAHQFTFRTQQSLLGYWRGSPSRQRRLFLAAVVLHPTWSNRNVARPCLISSESTEVELAAAALTRPGQRYHELKGLVRSHPGETSVLVEALQLFGMVDSLPAVLASVAARNRGALDGTAEGRERLEELVDVNTRWMDNDANAATVLDLCRRRMPRRYDDERHVVRDLLRRDTISVLLAQRVAESASRSDLDAVVRRAEHWATKQPQRAADFQRIVDSIRTKQLVHQSRPPTKPAG